MHITDDIPQTAPCTAASINNLNARFATTKSDTYRVVKSLTELDPANWNMNAEKPEQKQLNAQTLPAFFASMLK